jgi:hypothetical protein
MRGLLWVFLATVTMSWELRAQEVDYLRVDGRTVIYNGDGQDAPDRKDQYALLDVLHSHPEVDTLVLEGDFELSGTALGLGHIVEEFGLTTRIATRCSNACIYIFVSGRSRILDKNAEISVHRRSIPPSKFRELYADLKDQYAWRDVSAMSTYAFARGQADMVDSITHLMERGVTFDFAVKLFETPQDEPWTPTRSELMDGGVIPK